MPPASTRDDFLITGANRGALAMLDAPERWPQGRLLLIGGPGSGKSHLAGFWADEHGAQIVQGWTLSPAHIDDLIPQGGAVVVEDGHEIGANPAAEQGLFHLWNLTGARQGLLLITAQTPPRDWDIRLPDLRSRLDTAAQSVLPPPTRRCCLPFWSSSLPTARSRSLPRWSTGWRCAWTATLIWRDDWSRPWTGNRWPTAAPSPAALPPNCWTSWRRPTHDPCALSDPPILIRAA